MSYATLAHEQIHTDDTVFHLRAKHTSEETQSLGDFGIYNLPTTVTASFRSDSPKTMMNRTSLTWTSSNTARTATGSTAAIKLPNKRKSSSPVFRWPSKTKQSISGVSSLLSRVMTECDITDNAKSLKIRILRHQLESMAQKLPNKFCIVSPCILQGLLDPALAHEDQS